MFYHPDVYGALWHLCKKYLFVGVPVALAVVFGILFSDPACFLEEDAADPPVYDATCTDVAHQALEQCVKGRSHCAGVYSNVYLSCRDEVQAGRRVHFEGDRFVPAPDLCTQSLCDCTDAVGIAVAATVERCSQVLDCKNEDLHPDRCSEDCKYHAIEGAFQLGPHDTDPEWAPYATELIADSENESEAP